MAGIHHVDHNDSEHIVYRLVLTGGMFGCANSSLSLFTKHLFQGHAAARPLARLDYRLSSKI